MPTRLTYRQRAAKELGIFHSSTATSGSTVSVLEDATWPVTSTISQDDYYTNCFLLRPNATTASDRVRLIKTYTPTTGQLTPDKTWSVNPYANGTGEAYEIHEKIEPWTTLNDLINEALKRCFITVEFTLTPTEDDHRHSLASITWLTNPSWVKAVGYLGTNDDRDEVDPYDAHLVRGQVVEDGATLYLWHPNKTFNSTDTIYVQAIKPAYYHCKTASGSYGGQSGLSLDTDLAPPQVTEEWLAYGVLVEAWRSYAHLLEMPANQRIKVDRGEAAQMFSYHTRLNFKEPELKFRRLRYF